MENLLKPQCQFKKILFCTDFSENADFAFDFAVDQALLHKCEELTILHIIPEPEAQFWKTYIYEIEEVDSKAKKDIDHKIENSYKKKIPQNLNYQIKILVGKDYQKILEYAGEIETNLIIIGRASQSSLGKVLFGNVTEMITRKSECPVLIIPYSYEKKLNL